MLQFHNDAAPIRIFIKGLRNAQSVATRIYEKDPQTLKDTINEVEKFSAAQQLTATILPSSMSNEPDIFFQCQEPGHIVWPCPHIRYHDYEEYGHIIMDCPNKIPPSGTPAQHHRMYKKCHTRSSPRHCQEDWHRRDSFRSQSRYSRHHSSSHHDLYRGHSKSQQRDRHNCYRSSSRWSHSVHWGHSCRTHHDTPHWPHCRSSTHCGSSGHHSQDHSRSHLSYRSSKYNPHLRESCSSRSCSNQVTWRSHPNRNKKVHIEEHPSDFYSSDDNSTDTGEESESLN